MLAKPEEASTWDKRITFSLIMGQLVLTLIKTVIRKNIPEWHHFTNRLGLRHVHKQGISEKLQSSSCFKILRYVNCIILHSQKQMQSFHLLLLFPQKQYRFIITNTFTV